MIKYFQVIVLLLVLISCKSSKLPITDSNVHINERDSIFFDSEKEMSSLIFVRLNGKKIKLKLDTGATNSVINDISVIGGKKVLTPKNHEKNVNVQSATSNFKAIRYNVDDFNLNSISIQNYHPIIYETPKVNFNCGKGLFSEQGLLSLNVFAETNKMLAINFEKGFLSLREPKAIDLTDYKKVDATIERSRIFLTAIIDGKKKKMLLDTGANIFASLPDNPFEDDEIPKREYKTVSVVAGNSITPTKSLIYKNQPIQLGDILVKNTVLEVDSSHNSNILGFDFIKNFNWIIDFKNEEVYLKQYRTVESSSIYDKLETVENIAVAVNNKLMIIYSKEDYIVGSIIKTVNGNNITPENICDFQKLLIDNKESWEQIKIGIEN